MRSRRPLRRLPAVSVLVIAGVIAFALSAGGAASATVRQPDGLGDRGLQQSYERYVALGDSYTSGPFIPFQRLDPLGCARSTNNYPSLLALSLRVEQFVDVSCAGARTDHLTEPQSVALGSNPPQLDALDARTDLVTLGIGGNDFSVFGDLIAVCSQLRDTDPAGAPCREHFVDDGVDEMAERIADTEKLIEAGLDEIAARAPRADVFVIGYPRIVPVTGTCPRTLPFADGDYAYLDGVEQALNAALAAAAERAGARYVDTYEPSRDHDACGDAGRAWIQGQRTNVLWAASYHPNVYGMAGVAGISYAAITGSELPAPVEARLQRAVTSVERAGQHPEHAVDHTHALRLAAALGVRDGLPAHRQPVAGELLPTSR